MSARLDDPYPYMRGLVCELGYEIKTIPFNQPRRLRGISKNNLYTLYDNAMLGIVSHSKVPIRIAAFAGFLIGTMSVLAASGVSCVETSVLGYVSVRVGTDHDRRFLSVWGATPIHRCDWRIHRIDPYLCAKTSGSRRKRTDKFLTSLQRSSRSHCCSGFIARFRQRFLAILGIKSVIQGTFQLPFSYDKSDTFMDFFHPLYWSNDSGLYTVWGSVYPPLNFLFFNH